MFTDAIIMAGGSGTRLWPASSSALPKQFLGLPGGGTFFGQSMRRAFDCGIAGKVVVVTGEAHLDHVLQSCSELDASERARVSVIPERMARNTAPAIAAAATFLRREAGPGRRALVLTSDHVITPFERLRADVEAADALAAAGRLAVFGIPPRSPETGYGYIEAGDLIASRTAPERCFAVRSFREKPDLETARGFVESGSFFWNSGMFGFSVDAMLEELRLLAQDVIAPFDALGAPGPDARSRREGGVEVVDRWPGLDEAYGKAWAISIDYAVAERTKSAAMVAASFDWLDLGSWDEYSTFVENAEGGRDGTPSAPVVEIEASGCFVDSELPVALCGVDDLVVVVRRGGGADGGKPPAVLICRRGKTQLVKKAVEALKAKGRTDLL